MWCIHALNRTNMHADPLQSNPLATHRKPRAKDGGSTPAPAAAGAFEGWPRLHRPSRYGGVLGECPSGGCDARTVIRPRGFWMEWRIRSNRSTNQSIKLTILQGGRAVTWRACGPLSGWRRRTVPRAASSGEASVGKRCAACMCVKVGTL